MSGEPNDRVLMISSDGHVAAQSLDDFREYIPTAHHDDHDRFVVQMGAAWERMLRMFHGTDPNARREQIDAAHKAELAATGAAAGSWDPEHRLVVLERDGVVAEVLFPDHGGPFGISAGGIAPGIDRELQIVGARAYNRWLADFCASVPHRYAGQAVLWLHDVDAAVAEIRWARTAGLKGVMLPGIDHSLPLLWDPIYEPIWAVCEELELPVNFHVGSTVESYGGTEFGSIGAPNINPDVVMSVLYLEMTWHSRRPLWFLLLGGVLERHPGLKIVFTELNASWVPMTLAAMDYNWEHGRTGERTRDVVPRRPSEYWNRQCFVGASVLSRAEAEQRAAIGVDTMMFGVDFPHIESSWGSALPTIHVLQATLGAANATADETRAILGENAARAFGFDLAALRPIAERVGPSLASVLTPLVDPADELMENKFLRSEIMRPTRA